MKIWAVAFMFLAGLISCQSNAASSSENTTQHTQESTVAVSLNTVEWAEK